ncbi:MAG: hypothetical protein A3F14_07030 [Gammaproteobacteria bacterium RIFCSPHIGHO2_12_FULL_43_28]|nr:MAG: hypothetical protein A3F14_07030 [Gammaproteobacteria bacterium RIFCSPHIGHO2_12_FULL_43_28]
MKIKFIVPFFILFILFGFLYHELFYAKTNNIESGMIGEALTPFTLRDLNQPNAFFTEHDLTSKVSLLNVWATWCYACEIEVPMLLKIKEQYHIPIYSIDYKDNPADVNAWLKRYGNPYEKIGDDTTGQTAVDLGIYGTPETFVINKKGEILYRHVGVLDQKAWDTVLYPMIKRLA